MEGESIGWNEKGYEKGEEEERRTSYNKTRITIDGENGLKKKKRV